MFNFYFTLWRIQIFRSCLHQPLQLTFSAMSIYTLLFLSLSSHTTIPAYLHICMSLLPSIPYCFSYHVPPVLLSTIVCHPPSPFTLLSLCGRCARGGKGLDNPTRPGECMQTVYYFTDILAETVTLRCCRPVFSTDVMIFFLSVCKSYMCAGPEAEGSVLFVWHLL